MGTQESGIELSELVTKGFNYGIFFAALTGLIFSFTHKSQNRVGLFGGGKILHKMLIFPLLLIVLSLYVSYTTGAFTNTSVIKWVLINTFFVGISEELMFRGVFMSSFTSNKGYWPSVIWTTIIFGAIHVLNGFTTGEFVTSSLQALLAASSGLLFLAIRVKTLSIVPAITLHWLWDFTVFTSGLGDKSEMGALGLTVALTLIAGPIIFGIIGIISLRNKTTADAYVASQQ